MHDWSHETEPRLGGAGVATSEAATEAGAATSSEGVWWTTEARAATTDADWSTQTGESHRFAETVCTEIEDSRTEGGHAVIDLGFAHDATMKREEVCRFLFPLPPNSTPTGSLVSLPDPALIPRIAAPPHKPAYLAYRLRRVRRTILLQRQAALSLAASMWTGDDSSSTYSQCSAPRSEFPSVGNSVDEDPFEVATEASKD